MQAFLFADTTSRKVLGGNLRHIAKLQLQTNLEVAQMEQQRFANQADDVNLPGWLQWQRAVLALLRADVSGVLRSIQLDEVDWDAWHVFFIEGRSPRAAIDRALARDF
jgi:hypothetical protein